MTSTINVYPEKNKDVIIRWVVDYTDKDGQDVKLFCESEDIANKTKSKIEDQEHEIDELINDEGGLLSGDQPPGVGAVGSNEITSKSTTDDFVTATRQGVSRWFSYRRFYGEGIEDGITDPVPNKMKHTPFKGMGNGFKPKEITEVDKTAEALGDIYANSTDPIDFENKAKQMGYDDDEIKYRQERFFRKTSDDQSETNNTKIPLEEVDIVEDVLTQKSSYGDVISKTQNDSVGEKYSIPYYDQLKQNNPLIARKLIHLIDITKSDNIDAKTKASLIWQFLNGIGVDDLRPEDKNYIIKFITNGK